VSRFVAFSVAVGLGDGKAIIRNSAVNVMNSSNKFSETTQYDHTGIWFQCLVNPLDDIKTQASHRTAM